ncbi:MAG: hypothetical protein ACUVSQ_00100 [Pseudanabaenaceae cyanobacterium]
MADTIDDIRERLQSMEREFAVAFRELYGVGMEAEQHVARLVEMAQQVSRFGLRWQQAASRLRLLCVNARLAAARVEGTLALDAKDLELRAAAVGRAVAKMQTVAAQLQHTAVTAKEAMARLNWMQPDWTALPAVRPSLETAIATVAQEIPLREAMQALQRYLGLLSQGVELTLAWASKGDRSALVLEFTAPIAEMSRCLASEQAACAQMEGVVGQWSRDTLRLRQILRRLAIGLDRTLERLERMRPLQAAVQAEERRLAAIDLSLIFDLRQDDFWERREDRPQMLLDLYRTWGQARDLVRQLGEGYKGLADLGETLPGLTGRLRLLAVNATLAAVRSENQAPLAQELTQRADKLEQQVATMLALLARLQTVLAPMEATVDSLDRKVFGQLSEGILQKSRSWLGAPTDLGRRAGEASTYAAELGLLAADWLQLATGPSLWAPYESPGNGAASIGWEFGRLVERLAKAGRELGMTVGTFQRRSQATRLAMETVVAGVKVLAKRPQPLPPLPAPSESMPAAPTEPTG